MAKTPGGFANWTNSGSLNRDTRLIPGRSGSGFSRANPTPVSMATVATRADWSAKWVPGRACSCSPGVSSDFGSP
eukprot:10084822-Alexandrium_andersonii.AAC.1